VARSCGAERRKSYYRVASVSSGTCAPVQAAVFPFFAAVLSRHIFVAVIAYPSHFNAREFS